MPGAPSAAVINSMPCPSRLALILTTVDSRTSDITKDPSILVIVRKDTSGFEAKSEPDQPIAALAARICSPVSNCNCSKCAYNTQLSAHYGKSSMLDWLENFKRLEGAYAPATIRGYKADFEAFIRWCTQNDVLALPAEQSSIIRFLEAEAPLRAMNTINRRLYAIRRVHKLLGLSDPTDHEDVRLAFRKIRRSKFARPKQAKGLTSAHLKRFLDAQPDTLLGLRNKTMISVGYELLTRRSELVALRVEDIEFRSDGTLKAIIRRSKADPFGNGRLAFTSRDTTDLVREWLSSRVISPFLTGCGRRTYAAIFSFMAGVMPPMPMLGRSLL